ncbi:MAG TPA: hypothetical protein VF965_10380 [Candidatus Limnocylindria bacterium]
MLEVVGKTVIDAGIDIELTNPASEELALDRRDERPDETLPAIRRIDQHVEQARAAFRPRRSRDGESDQRRAVPRGHHHGVPVGDLPSHLARGERA